MNTALRLLRNELAWLADATRLATNTRTLKLEKTTGEIVFMQLDEIDRERAEIREAIDILESQRGGRKIAPGEPLELFEAVIYR